MNNTILTITLAIVIVCNLGMLWLYFKIYLWTRTPEDIFGNQLLILERLSAAATRQRGIKQAVLEEGKLTRERIGQVKTRLADEESDDQREKARVRYHKRHR